MSGSDKFKSLHAKVYGLLHKAWYPRVGVSQPMSICEHLVRVKNKYKPFAQVTYPLPKFPKVQVGFGLVRLIQPTECPFLVVVKVCTKITEPKVKTLHLISTIEVIISMITTSNTHKTNTKHGDWYANQYRITAIEYYFPSSVTHFTNKINFLNFPSSQANLATNYFHHQNI